MGLLIIETEYFKNEKIINITDEHGNELTDLHMVDYVVFNFESGKTLKLGIDWRGRDCYISQYE